MSTNCASCRHKECAGHLHPCQPCGESAAQGRPYSRWEPIGDAPPDPHTLTASEQASLRVLLRVARKSGGGSVGVPRVPLIKLLALAGIKD